jgi:hypothetical protein
LAFDGSADPPADVDAGGLLRRACAGRNRNEGATSRDARHGASGAERQVRGVGVHRAVHVGGILLRSARASEERILGISPRARQNCVRITGAGVARIQHPNCVGLKADPQGPRALLWVGLKPD